MAQLRPYPHHLQPLPQPPQTQQPQRHVAQPDQQTQAQTNRRIEPHQPQRPHLAGFQRAQPARQRQQVSHPRRRQQGNQLDQSQRHTQKRNHQVKLSNHQCPTEGRNGNGSQQCAGILLAKATHLGFAGGNGRFPPAPFHPLQQPGNWLPPAPDKPQINRWRHEEEHGPNGCLPLNHLAQQTRLHHQRHEDHLLHTRHQDLAHLLRHRPL